MERYKPALLHHSLICKPPAIAIWYRELVAPVASLKLQPKNEAHSTEQKDSSAQLLTKLRAPYDASEQQLKQIHQQLKQHSNSNCDSPNEFQEVGHAASIPTYVTALGILSFAELHERTRKYAAFALLHTYQVHSADVDDGLQAGYVGLWERLQQEPEILKDKSLAWIGKGIIYKALHSLRADWTYQNHIQAEEARSSTDRPGTQSLESRQADIRTDIHQAIVEVAQHILETKKGKRADYDLWALYGLTMLQVNSSETSRLFRVREQSMHVAYNRMRDWLKAALPHYAPIGETKKGGQHGPEALPQPDMSAIRQANQRVSGATYEAVQTRIATTNADTRTLDEIALQGIRQGIPITTQARQHNLPQYQMQRAYKRVHLLIAAEYDPTVRTLRPERRMKPVFTLTPETSVAVEQLALDFLKQPKSFEKLVALHAHIGNLAISTTAKNFNVPTSTLRYYSQQIAKHLKTPLFPARAIGSGKCSSDEASIAEVTDYSAKSAAD